MSNGGERASCEHAVLIPPASARRSDPLRTREIIKLPANIMEWEEYSDLWWLPVPGYFI